MEDAYVKKLNGRFRLDYDRIYRDRKGERRWIVGAEVRAGNDVNAPEGTMILSGLFTATYLPGLTKEQFALVGGFEITDLPDEEYFFWKEPYTFEGTAEKALPCKQLTGTGGGSRMYPIGGSMIFVGWNSTLSLDGEPLTREITIPAERLSDDFSFAAIWDFRIDLLFAANGSSNPKEAGDYELYDYAAETLMPENDGPSHLPAFTKIDQGKTTGYFRKAYDHKAAEKYHYDKNREKYVDFHEQYAFEGWSKRTDCLYRDEDIFHPGDYFSRRIMSYQEKLDWFLTELNQITKAHDRTFSAQKVEIVMYAVWDRFPEIQALDRYFLKKEVARGKVKKTELLKKAEATDLEDGTLGKGSQLVLVDFDPKDFDIEGDSGSATVRYGATDFHLL